MKSLIFDLSILQVCRLEKVCNAKIYQLLPVMDKFQRLVANEALRLIHRDRKENECGYTNSNT